MRAISIVMCLLYVVCGLFTLRFLKKHRLHVAYVLYFALFLVLLAYLPYLTGSRLMLRFLSNFLHEQALGILEATLLEPLSVAIPCFTFSFIIAIFVSLLLCIAVALLALTVYRYVARKLRKLFAPQTVRKKLYLLSPAAPIPPERAARYIFCRYNC